MLFELFACLFSIVSKSQPRSSANQAARGKQLWNHNFGLCKFWLTNVSPLHKDHQDILHDNNGKSLCTCPSFVTSHLHPETISYIDSHVHGKHVDARPKSKQYHGRRTRQNLPPKSLVQEFSRWLSPSEFQNQKTVNIICSQSCLPSAEGHVPPTLKFVKRLHVNRGSSELLWSSCEKHVAGNIQPAWVATRDTIRRTFGMDSRWSRRMMIKALAVRRIHCHTAAATLPGAWETHQPAAKPPWHLWVTPMGHHLHHHHVWNRTLMLVFHGFSFKTCWHFGVRTNEGMCNRKRMFIQMSANQSISICILYI